MLALNLFINGMKYFFAILNWPRTCSIYIIYRLEHLLLLLDYFKIFFTHYVLTEIFNYYSVVSQENNQVRLHFKVLCYIKRFYLFFTWKLNNNDSRAQYPSTKYKVRESRFSYRCISFRQFTIIKQLCFVSTVII